jgi:hypothetical protein
MAQAVVECRGRAMVSIYSRTRGLALEEPVLGSEGNNDDVSVFCHFY